MDGTYRKFLESGLDLTALGVERRAENAPYFCTPKGLAPLRYLRISIQNIGGFCGFSPAAAGLRGQCRSGAGVDVGRGNI